MVKSDKIEEIRALKKALNQEKRKNKTLEKRYSEEKLKNKLLKCDSKKKSERIDSLLSLGERKGADRIAIPRHRHGEIAIRFAVLLYAFAGISSHQVPKVMQLAELLWNGITDDIPSHVTVLHLELKASSEHPGHSLKHADVSVLRLKAGKGWNTEMIKGQLEQTIKEEGRKPDYVVSDNGQIMCIASETLGLTHHKDISHSFGVFLENVYSKDPEFADFIAKKGYARKFSHTAMAPLMPPRRREYARFMNVFDTVHWAKAILENEHLLSSHERYMLSFVRSHASLVEELDDVMHAYEYMEQLCKQYGLSHKTASECRRYINQNLMTKGDRVRRLTNMLIAYFNREEALLDGDEVHNITSDIIESTFGCFKARMSPNKNNGYTPLVLLIPLSLKVSTIDDCRNFNVSHLLARTTITDIKKWRGDNLLPNPSIKRMNVVKNIA